jgi:hypothetical protein
MWKLFALAVFFALMGAVMIGSLVMSGWIR